MKQGTTIAEENAWLKRQFETMGLDVTAVWAPTPDRPDIETRQLRQLLHWALAYRTWPDRAELMRRGYAYPPVEPDIDPESDWLRFERWMQGGALTWRAEEAGIRLQPANRLTDAEIERELERVVEALAERNVQLDFQEGVPQRRVYEYLARRLPGLEFEFLAPDTVCHMDGCDGDCGACFQRDWCDLGSIEDDLPVSRLAS